MTKRDISNVAQCHKLLWLSRHKQDSAPEFDLATKLRIKNGQRMGEIAKSQFDGVEADHKGISVEQAAIATQTLIEQGHKTIFEATVIAGDLITRADVIEKSDSGWIITEIKSGVSPKPAYIEDVAFQWLVFQKAGIPVDKCQVGYVNKAYRKGEAEPFIVFEDVTEKARACLDVLDIYASEVRLVADLPEIPEVEINTYCNSPNPCPFHQYCWQDVSDEDLAYLPRVKAEQVASWRKRGIRLISQLPDDEKLIPTQSKIRKFLIGNTTVDQPKLKECMSQFVFPIVFVDFEVASPSIPVIENTGPYTAIPFQWSGHILTEDGNLEHKYFLGREFGDPREEFVSTLYDLVQDAGSVVYYSSFEYTIAKKLSSRSYPRIEETTRIFKQRGIDLLKIVQDCVYHKEFRGSYSIKKVLPALVPSLTYDGMLISDGQSAAAIYAEGMLGNLTREESEDYLDALEEYCKLDTLAMVRIYEALLAACE